MTFRYIIEDVIFEKYYNENLGLVASKFAATWYKTETAAIEAYKDNSPFIVHKMYCP